MTPNNHDNFIRAVFSTPDHAAAFLAMFLGHRFLQAFDLSTLTLVPGTHVDGDLRRHEFDLLFRLEGPKKPVFIYVLVEHQSTPFAMMPIKLFRYVSKIYSFLGVENRSRRELPEIIPVVLYNGVKKWSAPLSLRGLHHNPHAAEMVGLAPIDLGYKLIDLSTISDAQIQRGSQITTSAAVLALLLLKNFRDMYFGKLLRKWASFFGQAFRETRGENFVRAAVWYILQTTNADHQDLITSIVSQTEPEMESMIKTTGQKLKEEGREEGLREGLQKGLQEGRAKERQALLKAVKLILTSRFPKMTEEQCRMIDGADVNQLDIYLDRALEAGSVDEVLQ